jgi:hypothetical protein
MAHDSSRDSRPIVRPDTRTPLGQPALQAPPARKGGGMQGDLAAYALPDLLQFLHNLRKDGQLVIERAQPAQSASIDFVEGRLVHAYCPPLQGEECLQYLLSWRSGRFIFLADAAPVRETIRRDFRTAVLDAVRQHDELQQVLTGLPPAETVFHRDRNQERLAEISLTLLEWRVLGRFDGLTTLGELLESFPRDQIAVAKAVGRLYAAGLISATPAYGFLGAIVLRAVAEHAELTDGDLQLAGQVLRACDGLHSLREIQHDLGCSETALLDAVEALHHALAVELVQGQAEFDQHISRC